jgi:uncharacterized cupredoxin-like copper-binding protein
MPVTSRTRSLPLAQLLAMAGIGAAVLLLGIHLAHAGSAMPADTMPGMSHGAHGAPAKTKFAFGEPGKPEKVSRAVTITMGDMSFEHASLRATVGETIRFVVVNKSEIDHDFTIGDAKTQVAHRKEMAEAFEHNDGQMEHAGDPNAVLVKAGETKELLWKFTRAGRLEFDCNIPGHYEAGMKGVIAVERKPAAKVSDRTRTARESA